MKPGLKFALPLALLASGLQAQMAKPQDLRQAKQFQSLVLPGKQVNPAVRKLLKLKWHKKLRNAAAHARTVKKPILLVISKLATANKN